MQDRYLTAKEEKGPAKIFKKRRKKFGGKEKVRIFAIPLGNEGFERRGEGTEKDRKIIDKAGQKQVQQSTENN